MCSRTRGVRWERAGGVYDWFWMGRMEGASEWLLVKTNGGRWGWGIYWGYKCRIGVRGRMKP